MRRKSAPAGVNKMGQHYIDAQTFEDFKTNQEKLIRILNHNITKMRIDICWIKILLSGLFISIFVELILRYFR
jgi:hypothetical protein